MNHRAMIIIVILSFAMFSPCLTKPASASFDSSIMIGTTASVGSCLDPARAYDYFSWEILQSLGCGLVEYEAGATGSVDDIIPSLATSWDVSKDGLVWTFNLRQGVKYEDGTEFNATHVKYTFDRGIGIADGDGAFVGIGYDGIISNVTVADKYVVKFYLKIPFAAFLSLMACQASYIVDPAHAPMTSVVEYTDGNARASHPMGLGPYTLTNWTRTAGKDYEIRLLANPNYWNNASGYPKTKNMIIKFYADSTGLALAIKALEIDIAFRQLAAADINDMKTNTNLKVWEGTGAFIQYLVLQEKYAPFNDTRIRQAVGAAINRTTLVETVFLGQAQKLYSMIPNGMFGHTDAFLTLGDPNYTKTRELLGQLGYNEANKLSFKLWYETSGHYPSSPEQAQVLKSSLEASGVISVTLDSADWPSYRTHRQSEDMEAYILGWYPDYVDPDDYTYPLLHSTGGSWLHNNYADPEMDTLIENARATTNATERDQVYAQIQLLTAQDCPLVPLFQAKTYAVTKASVEGIYLDMPQLLRYWLLYSTNQPTTIRSAGVKVGDWARYDLEVNYSTNDPFPPIVPTPGLTEWKSLTLTVLSVEGTNVTYEQGVQFQNGTEYSISQWIDVDSGQMNYGTVYTGFLIAANLTAGDHVYSPFTPVINSTIARYYGGMEREVNFLSDNPGYGESEYFWDRASGIIVEVKADLEATHGEYSTYLFLHLIMLDTNIWSGGVSVSINVTPEALNLQSQGKWITVQIELPEGYKAKDVVPSTVLLNGTIPPEAISKGRGSSQIIVKFSRQQTTNLILESWKGTGKSGRVTLTITGKLVDDTLFQGNATIKIVAPKPVAFKAFII